MFNSMLYVLYGLHWFAALVIALQSIDRIAQCALLQKGMCAKTRFSTTLKGIAWACMASAALGVLAAPLFRGNANVYSLLINPYPSLGEVGMFVGFAVLILRSWINEEMRLKHSRRRNFIPICSSEGPQPRHCKTIGCIKPSVGEPQA